MTESYAGSPTPDDIDDDLNPTTRLGRQADVIITEAEGRPFGPTTSIREAVLEDLDEGRKWASARADRAREAIREEPMRTALYALGAGVLLGLLLRR